MAQVVWKVELEQIFGKETNVYFEQHPGDECMLRFLKSKEKDWKTEYIKDKKCKKIIVKSCRKVLNLGDITEE